MQAKTKKSKSKYRFVSQDVPRSSDIWDFQRDGLSPSYINTFLRCREEFRLATVEGYREKSYDFSIEFGNIWHWLHDQWVAHGDEMPGIKAAIATYKSEVFDPAFMTPEDRAEQEIGYAMTYAMWPAYQKYYRRDAERAWATYEETFNVPYTFECDGERVTTQLRGKIDGAWFERKDLWLHDMKSKGTLNPTELEMMLHLDVQMLTYALIFKIATGRQVSGVEMDMVRRPGTRPRKGESIEAYVKRLKTEVSLDPAHYFVRVPLYLCEADVEAWRETTLDPILCDVYRWSIGRSPHYVNPGGLVPRPWRSRYATLICTGDTSGLERGDPFAHHT